MTKTEKHYTELAYKSANFIRNSGSQIPMRGTSADYHLRFDLDTLRAESQMFYRDSNLYRGMINRAVESILGNGYQLQCNTGDNALNNKIESLWKTWCLDCEVQGNISFKDLEKAVTRYIFIDGDLLILKLANGDKPYSGKLQLIEANRVHSNSTSRNNNRIVDGIEVDSYGRNINFDVVDYSPNGIRSSNSKIINANDVIYLANRDRIGSQTRGVPPLQANFSQFLRIEAILNSTTVVWQLLAKYALISNRNNAQEQAYNETGSDENSTETYQQPPRYQEVGNAGIIWNAEPGEALTAFKYETPSMNFEQNIVMMIRLLGVDIGIPLEIILLDFSRTNYSSARASLLTAYRNFINWQEFLKNNFHSKVLNWKIQQWIEQGLLPNNNPQIFNYNWVVAKFPWIDLLKETSAYKEQIDSGMSSLSEVCATLGKDRDTVLVQQAKDIENAYLKTQELNNKYPEMKLDWRVLAGITNKETINVPNDKDNVQEINNQETRDENDEPEIDVSGSK